MHNVFQHQREEEGRSRQEERLRSEQGRKLRTATQNEVLHRTALLRASDWANEHLSPALATTLQEGAVPLLHPTSHRFRDADAGKNIYVRTYRPASLRASDAEADFRLSHLEDTPYPRHSPRRDASWLRQSPEAAEQFCFRAQEDRARLLRRVKRCRFVQTETSDLCAAPTPAKRKWAADHDFKRFSKHFGTNAVWRTPQRLREHYIDGLENLGRVGRKRDLAKETAGAFKTVTPKEVWTHLVPPLTSLRFTKADFHFSKLTETSASTTARSNRIYKKSVERQLIRAARAKLQRSTSELRTRPPG